MTKYSTKYIVNKGLDRLKKDLSTSEGSGITLKNNEMTDIMKVNKSSENWAILIKGATRKSISQEGGFSNFLRSLMTTGLPLMKNVLKLLAKGVLLPFGLSAAMSATDAAIQKKL